MTPAVSVDNLSVTYSGDVQALSGVSFEVHGGDSIAVVGETGAGKSTLALCLAGMVRPPQASGSVQVGDVELLGASAEQLREAKWRKVAIALQGVPFNPVVRLGDQIAEPMRHHLGMSAGSARRKTEALCREIALPVELLTRYPHEVSGGQRRRAALAMALALDPEVLVLDEPTAGIDPAARLELCQRITDLRHERGFALVTVTHDLSDAQRLGARCLVMYAGQVMEQGLADRVLGDPAHPYTWGLVGSYPLMSTTKELRTIRGTPPDPRAVPPGCPFHPRCTQAEAVCSQHSVRPVPSRGRDVACHFGGLTTVLSARNVAKSYGATRALEGVALDVRHGEAVGIIGASGSGKTTLARILAGHLRPDLGEVFLEQAPLPGGWGRVDRLARRQIQLVMQDPWDSLSPHLTVEELIAEPLDLERAHRPARRQTTSDALSRVGLPSEGAFLRARTHQLSGGQLQRIALARALVARPKVLVADEPTASLDASEQARVLLLLKDLQVQEGLALVLISHDVAVVRKLTDRTLVLDSGRVVEEGRSNNVSSAPHSAAARGMVEAAARLDSYLEPAVDERGDP